MAKKKIPGKPKTDKTGEKPLKLKDKVQLREELDFFPGGAQVNLDQKTEENKTLRDELSNFLGTLLNEELESQKQLEENLIKWQKQYRGEKPPKSFPWPKAANVSIPLTSWLVDNIVVRIMDAILGQKKIFM